MLPAHVTTHRADAIGRLVSQYKNKPSMESLAGIIGARSQTLEDVVWELVTLRVIGSGVGAQLDDLGAILGEARQARSDSDFRIYLAARILLNKCSGTPEQLLELFVKVLSVANPGQGVTLLEIYPAALAMVLEPTASDSMATALAILLKKARPSAINGQVIWAPQTPPTTFTLALQLVLSSGAGWGGALTVTLASPLPSSWPASGTCQISEATATVQRGFTKTDSTHLQIDSPYVPVGMTAQLTFTLIDTTRGLAHLDVDGLTPIAGGHLTGAKQG